MNRIIILIILVISFFSCKENNRKLNSPKKGIKTTYYKKDSVSNFDILSKLDKQIKNKKTRQRTYKILDSIKSHIDGAEAEYYLEIYKNSILNDSVTFKAYHKNNNVLIDYDVIDFFSVDINILSQICKHVYDLVGDYYDVAEIHDKDGFVNLRNEPNSKSIITNKIDSGKLVKILNKEEDWWLVLYNDKVGYIHKSRLKLIK